MAHAVLDGVAGAAIGLTFATGLVLVPRGASQIGQILVTIATVLSVGVLRWPMLPVILCLAPVEHRPRARTAAGAELTCPTTGGYCWR